jgi:hypothetical protein
MYSGRCVTRLILVRPLYAGMVTKELQAALQTAQNVRKYAACSQGWTTRR